MMPSAPKLVPSDSSHAEVWYEWRQDPEAKRYNPFDVLDVEKLKERLARASSDTNEYSRVENFVWLISVNHQIVGNISVHSINKSMLTAEIGYMIAPWARGKGFATFAVRKIGELCFKATPLRKLIAMVHVDNLPSRRVLEKLGFKAEGTLREHYLIEGKPVNEIIYGMLSREWK